MQSAVLSGFKPAPGEIAAMLEYITTHPDHTAYHSLFAVRRKSPDDYRQVPIIARAQVLCSALTQLTFLNDWGYLDPAGSHDGEAALALLELGKAAVERLVPVLNDSRPAPLFGSEPATLAATYHYRRKDFAYRYLSLILGRAPAFAADPQSRDREIEQLTATCTKLKE